MPTSLLPVMIFMGYREVTITLYQWLSFLGKNGSALYAPLLVCALGDIDSVVIGAKSMVREANGITSEVLDGLNPIQTDLGRIKDSYESARREDFSKALVDANNSGQDVLAVFSIAKNLIHFSSFLVNSDLN
jgi:hypothetical protein